MAATAGECVGGAGVSRVTGGRVGMAATAWVGNGVTLLLSGDSIAAIASQSAQSIVITMAIAAMVLGHHHVFDGAV